jgi:hypothetical protein
MIIVINTTNEEIIGYETFIGREEPHLGSMGEQYLNIII